MNYQPKSERPRVTLRLSDETAALAIEATIADKTLVIRDVAFLRTFLDEHRDAVTITQCLALGALHVLLVASDLGSVEVDALYAEMGDYRPRFTDPACSNAFAAGSEAAVFDLRMAPSAPLIPALRSLAATALA